MSENPIVISNLNDFIFCPVSIYFHSLEEETNEIVLQDSFQLNGTAAHIKSDSAAYSTKKSMLQGISIYCEKYNLCGKIDTFDVDNGILTEIKMSIKDIFFNLVILAKYKNFVMQRMKIVIC